MIWNWIQRNYNHILEVFFLIIFLCFCKFIFDSCICLINQILDTINYIKFFSVADANKILDDTKENVDELYKLRELKEKLDNIFNTQKEKSVLNEEESKAKKTFYNRYSPFKK